MNEQGKRPKCGICKRPHDLVPAVVGTGYAYCRYCRAITIIV